MTYHKPALLQQAVDALAIDPDGTYVDVTFGGGGHSREILSRLQNGRLIAFDMDPDAAENADFKDDRLELVPQNFKYLKRFLRLHSALPVDGILADLGVSFHQFDTAERGFSIRFEGPLDMRMDQSGQLTAADVINNYDAESLQEMFGMLGEVRNARTLAQHIALVRTGKPIRETQELITAIEPCIMGQKNRYLAQVFQALRMEVNCEIENLKELLQQSAECLKEGGRLVVISYHSLEDRLVKQFMKNGCFADTPERDLYGKAEIPFKTLKSKPIIPDESEIKENPRARSAKMRVAVRKAA